MGGGQFAGGCNAYERKQDHGETRLRRSRRVAVQRHRRRELIQRALHLITATLDCAWPGEDVAEANLACDNAADEPAGQRVSGSAGQRVSGSAGQDCTHLLSAAEPPGVNDFHE
ncbi:protein of unknown function [Pararobbsia alpina]